MPCNLAFLAVAAAIAVVPGVAAHGFDINDVIARHNAGLWHVGQGITPGDFFVYAVCDSSMRPATDACYTVRLDFYAEMLSPSGETWVVQAEITRPDHSPAGHHIFLVDSDTMRVRTDLQGGRYADSVEDTVFYLARFAPVSDPKQLAIGTVWGPVPSVHDRADLVTMVEDSMFLANNATVPVTVLEYWMYESSTFAISAGIGLPVYATVHNPYAVLDDPSVAFTFELIDFAHHGHGQHTGRGEPIHNTTITRIGQ